MERSSPKRGVNDYSITLPITVPGAVIIKAHTPGAYVEII